MEETGLEIKMGKPLFVFAFMSNPNRHQFQIIYECEYLGGDPQLNPDEHDLFQWVDVEDLKELPMIPFLKAYVEEKANE